MSESNLYGCPECQTVYFTDRETRDDCENCGVDDPDWVRIGITGAGGTLLERAEDLLRKERRLDSRPEIGH